MCEKEFVMKRCKLRLRAVRYWTGTNEMKFYDFEGEENARTSFTWFFEFELIFRSSFSRQQAVSTEGVVGGDGVHEE